MLCNQVICLHDRSMPAARLHCSVCCLYWINSAISTIESDSSIAVPEAGDFEELIVAMKWCAAIRGSCCVWLSRPASRCQRQDVVLLCEYLMPMDSFYSQPLSGLTYSICIMPLIRGLPILSHMTKCSWPNINWWEVSHSPSAIEGIASYSTDSLRTPGALIGDCQFPSTMGVVTPLFQSQIEDRTTVLDHIGHSFQSFYIQYELVKELKASIARQKLWEAECMFIPLCLQLKHSRSHQELCEQLPGLSRPSPRSACPSEILVPRSTLIFFASRIPIRPLCCKMDDLSSHSQHHCMP